MNQKALIAILVVLVVGLGVAFAMTRSAAPVVAPTQETDVTSTGAVAAPASAPAGTYTWNFVDMGEDPELNASRTKVSLVTGGKSHDLGTFQGTCAVKTTDLLANEKSAALCWFAGAGDELGVFEEGGKLVVKHGEVQEPSGEGEGFRGNFKTVLAL